MCLLKGRQNESCLHHWCELAAKKPQYWAIFKSNYIMTRPGLQSFKMSKMPLSDENYILPVNPFEQGTDQHKDFEIFRQSMHTHTDCFGCWPSDRDTFAKSEVEFIIIEVTENVHRTICCSERSPLIARPDLKEVAIYVGEGSTNHQLFELDNYNIVYDVNFNDATTEKQETIEHEKAFGIPLLTSRRLSAAAMVLEGRYHETTRERRSQILDALEKGVNVMQRVNVQADRIMFIDCPITSTIEVWID